VDWSYAISGGALAVSAASLVVAGASYRHTVRKAREQQRAALHAEQLEARQGPSDEFDWRITNEGPAIARQVEIWIKSTYSHTAGQSLGPPLQAGESREVTISAAHGLTRSGAPMALRARWSDGTGERDEELLPIRS